MIFSKLYSIMGEKGLKPYPLSRESKLSRSFIESLMSNNFERLSAKGLNTLCHYLDIKSLDELLVFEPVEIYIKHNENGYVEFEPIIYTLGFKGNIDFNFDEYVNILNENKPIIEMLIEIEKHQYLIDVTYKIVTSKDNFHDMKINGIDVIFNDLSFSDKLPINALHHLKVWIYKLFSSYISKTLDVIVQFANYPSELENKTIVDNMVNDNISIINKIEDLSEQQSKYYETILSYLKNK